MNYLEKEVEKAILTGQTYRILLTNLNGHPEHTKKLCSQLDSHLGYKKTIRCWYTWAFYNLSLEESRNKFKSSINCLQSYQKQNPTNLGIILIEDREFENLKSNEELNKYKPNNQKSFLDILLSYIKLR